MGALDSRGDLAIAEIAFYSPALLIGVAINIKQGFSGGSSWIYLVLLSILRLIGASCTLYSETQNDYSQSLEETAFITSAIGKSYVPFAVEFVGKHPQCSIPGCFGNVGALQAMANQFVCHEVA